MRGEIPVTEPVKNIIGIIAAEVNSIEQRQIAKGIISRAQECGYKTVVLSNLYNPYEYSEALALENDVYQLMLSDQLCALILVEEFVISEKLRELICELLGKRTDIPVVILGIYIKELDRPNVCFIDTDDEADMAEIIRHLVETHNLTKIDILTGFRNNDGAERRVQGYRRTLESHGLPYDPARVHYGNFWFDSGQTLAEQYLNGTYEMPEAVACANDFMAFGMLDIFLKNKVRVPEDIIVMGYEFIHERIYHSPRLSTYYRDRFSLGQTAITILDDQLNGREPAPFRAPHGKWALGESCGCGTDPDQLREELEVMRTKQQYEKWNVLGTLEQQLTLCSNLDEFIDVLGKHQYLVRWVQNMFLCLYENWYDTASDKPIGMLNCRSVMPWNKYQAPVTCSSTDFSALYANSPDTAVHYYLPLFFEKHHFGFYVLEYHEPDAYDDTFRSWMKSVSIGLAFLCMKNDIRYLIQCQNLSEQHDALTGLLNQRGAEKSLAVRMADSAQPVYAIALKIGVFQSKTQSEQTDFLQKTADILRTFATQSGICCRIDTQLFVCAGFPCTTEQECKMLQNKLFSILLHSTNLLETTGMESVLCCSAQFDPEKPAKEGFEHLKDMLAAESAQLAAQKSSPHSGVLFSVRNRLYSTLAMTAENICKEYSFSAGYFRQIYKDCFGISFHQDAICARISRAVHLLSTTVMSISAIAEECGYEDYNYFLRQFQKVTGRTPGQFRKGI